MGSVVSLPTSFIVDRVFQNKLSYSQLQCLIQLYLHEYKIAVSFQYQYYVLVPYPIIVNEKVPKFYIYLQIIKHSLNWDTLHNENPASGGGGVENTICQAMFRFEPPAKTYRHTWLEKPTLWKTKGRTAAADSFIKGIFQVVCFDVLCCI